MLLSRRSVPASSRVLFRIGRTVNASESPMNHPGQLLIDFKRSVLQTTLSFSNFTFPETEYLADSTFRNMPCDISHCTTSSWDEKCVGRFSINLRVLDILCKANSSTISMTKSPFTFNSHFSSTTFFATQVAIAPPMLCPIKYTSLHPSFLRSRKTSSTSTSLSKLSSVDTDLPCPRTSIAIKFTGLLPPCFNAFTVIVHDIELSPAPCTKSAVGRPGLTCSPFTSSACAHRTNNSQP
mmetsp:Transcript_8431/g.13673  ORF Transcript_8431/g.13673 Transcript_8431/m.13673 type:complete len:238 (+) Transcript_8431:948-1661(+)